MLVLSRSESPDPRVIGLGAEDHSELRILNRSNHPLVITLQPGETLGVFQVVKIMGRSVRVGCEFPRDLTVLRGELIARDLAKVES